MPWILNDRNPLKENSIETNRLKIHYFEAGKDDGYPVILLHEELANARWWVGMQQVFPYRYHTFAPDLRGYGGSAGNTLIKVGLSDFSEDLWAFTQSLNLKEFFLIGWGLGGIIAMQFMSDHPEVLRGVGLVNTMLPIAGNKNPYSDAKIRNLARSLYDNNANDAARAFRENFFLDGNFPVGNLKSDGNLNGTGDHADAGVFDYLVEGSLGQQANPGDTSQELYQSLSGLDAANILKNFKKPIAVFSTKDDAIINHKMSEELLAATNPDGEFPRENYEMVLIGHSPMVEEMEAFADNLAGWLGRYTTDKQYVISPSATT